MYNVVGLTGVAQAGKDTAAQVLIEKHGFRRIAFADVLRKMLYQLNPIIDNTEAYRLRTLVDMLGWEKAKTFSGEVRTLLQRLGTEAGREILGENIWVNTALRDVKRGEKIVITDIRFDNEARAIHNMEGLVIKIHRPGFGSVNGHASEQGVKQTNVDAFLPNDGTLAQLHDSIEKLVGVKR